MLQITELGSTQLESLNLHFLNRDVAAEWQYRCIDILDIFETHYPDDTNYRIEEVEVYRHAYNDIWVDEVVIAGRATTENVEGEKKQKLWYLF